MDREDRTKGGEGKEMVGGGGQGRRTKAGEAKTNTTTREGRN